MSAALARQLLERARKAGLRVATAESCTGGLVGAAITEIAGSSDIFDGAVVSYSNAAKVALLGVRPETLAAHGAVSEAVAQEMAEGARLRFGSDLAVAITGIAGPGGSERKPEGRVCFGLARTGVPARAETVEFGAQGRARVRAAATDHALGLLIAAC
jgi:nicotinamide-nucleotide amidase